MIGVIAMTITLSVVAHGITASPWAKRYGAWAQRIRPTIETQGAVEPIPVRRSSGGLSQPGARSAGIETLHPRDG